MNRRWIGIIAVAVGLGSITTVTLTASQGPGGDTSILPKTGADAGTLSRAAREEQAIQDARRQQLADREAALAIKEEELQKLGDKVEARLKELEEAKSKYDAMIKSEEERQTHAESENVAKMVKLFRTMKADETAQLLDNMNEREVRLLLDRLDTKTLSKLVPNLNQPRTIRWVNENLSQRVAEKQSTN